MFFHLAITGSVIRRRVMGQRNSSRSFMPRGIRRPPFFLAGADLTGLEEEGEDIGGGKGRFGREGGLRG